MRGDGPVARRWAVGLFATTITIGLAACGDTPDEASGAITVETVPAGPEVASATYQEIVLDRDPTNGAINPRMAVATSHVLFYGGATVADEKNTELVAQGHGAVLDLESESVSDTPEWPHGAPPYQPGVVAVDDGFVVLGTPCAERVSPDSDVGCEGPAKFARFDPVRGAWTVLPAPSEQLELGSYPSVVALGAVDGWAYFTYDDDRDAPTSLLGYDTSGSAWREFGRFASIAAQHCVSSSGLLRGYVEGNELKTERLDLESGEWKSTRDGERSKLPTPAAEGAATEFENTGQEPPPLLDCAGDQLLAFNRGVEATEAMYWYVDADSSWYRLPVPATGGIDNPSSALVADTLLLWPEAMAGEPQVLSAGTWQTIEGAPALTQPRVAVAGDSAIVMGRPRTDNGEPGPLRIGRVIVETR
jgi:hypothetical protein